MEIRDNFLPKDIFKKLQTFMYSDDMEWHYRDAQVKPTDEEYFVHCFFNNSLPLSRHFYLMDDKDLIDSWGGTHIRKMTSVLKRRVNNFK